MEKVALMDSFAACYLLRSKHPSYKGHCYDGVVINAIAEQEDPFRRLATVHWSRVALLGVENADINLVETRQSIHFDASAPMVGLLEEQAVRFDT
jgi:hypothetical protein